MNIVDTEPSIMVLPGQTSRATACDPAEAIIFFPFQSITR